MNEVIAAIATASGNSGLSIIRISGDDAISVADKLYRSPSGNFHLSDASANTIHYGHIFYNDELIDEVLVSVFFAPKSFTAENVVEISCHGGAFVTKKILNAVLNSGARIADPGEFTKRAFLNGRIDLSQAEAVIDIINSKNEFALGNSLSQLNGRVFDEIRSSREKILHETAFLEAAMDDPEHYSLDEHRDEMISNIEEIDSNITHILSISDDGRLLKDGVNTLILGKPNAGKSSLLNILVGKDRAIVTSIAGTTRDTLEETVSLSGLTLNLIDTAGIRETDDVIEKIGVDRAISSIDKADLILYVVDSSVPIDDNDIYLIEKIKNKRIIIIRNKTDLNEMVSHNDLLKYIDAPIVDMCCNGALGIDLLSDIITNMFLNKEISFDEDIYVTNMRQITAIKSALSSIKMARESIENYMPEDIITIDLMDAYFFLGEVTGEQVSDDLVNKIFSDFCMGK